MVELDRTSYSWESAGHRLLGIMHFLIFTRPLGLLVAVDEAHHINFDGLSSCAGLLPDLLRAHAKTVHN